MVPAGVVLIALGTAARAPAASLPKMWGLQADRSTAGQLSGSALSALRAKGLDTILAGGSLSRGARRTLATRARLAGFGGTLRPHRLRHPWHGSWSAAARRACPRRRGKRCAVLVTSRTAARKIARARAAPIVAVRVRRPGNVGRLAGLSTRVRVLAVVGLTAPFDEAAWTPAIQAARGRSLDLAVDPSGSSALAALDSYLALRTRLLASGSGCTANCRPTTVRRAAGNLWVDGGGGSCSRSASAGGYVATTACRSFGAALGAAQPGDFVLVRCRGGSCRYPAATLSGTHGTAGNRVTFQAAPGFTVSFDAATGSHTPVFLDGLHGVDFVDIGFGTNDVGAGSGGFDGNLRIDCSSNVTVTNGSGRRFHFFEGNRNITFAGGSWGGYRSRDEEDSSIGTTGAGGPQSDSCGGGGTPGPSSYITFDGVQFHDVFWQVPESAWGGAHPDCLEINGYTDHLTISNSEFFHCGNTFLSVYGNQGINHYTTITHNRFHDLGDVTYYGLQIHGDGSGADEQRCGNLVFSDNSYSPNNPNAQGPYSGIIFACAPDSGYAPTEVVGNTFDAVQNQGSNAGDCQWSQHAPYFTHWHANTWLRGSACSN